MKVMLIGGTGVLSRDIAKKCIESNIELYMINRGNRLYDIPEETNVIISDINDLDKISEKLKNMYFDVVIDFLSYKPNQLSMHMEVFKDKCNQYIFISSATAYSLSNPEELITENTPLTNYNWEYSKNKILCENFLIQNYKTTSPYYTIIRPYITYGDTRIPFAFIHKKRHWSLVDRIINGKPIVVWDEGKNLTTLTHTEDFAKGVVGLIGNQKAFNQDFHIASDKQLTWVEALNNIGEAINRIPNIVYVPSLTIEKEFRYMQKELSSEKAITRKFDNSKIKKAVDGFQYNIDFKDGIKQTIEYYKKTPRLLNIDKKWDKSIDIFVKKYI